MENQPAPTRASKRIKLARAAREKLRPRSNETLAALPKSTFINSVVSALPSRDESFFSLGEGTNRHHGPVAKELGGGARHLRPYMATNAEDAAPPKGQVIRTRPNEIHVRELHAIARRKQEAEAKAAARAKRLAAAKREKERKKNKAGGSSAAAAAAAAAGGGGGAAVARGGKAAAGAAAKRPRVRGASAAGNGGGGAGPSSAVVAPPPPPPPPPREPLAAAPAAVRDPNTGGAA